MTVKSPIAQEIQRGASVARMPRIGAHSMAKSSFGPIRVKIGAKASEKKMTVSSTEPKTEPSSGAFHQVSWRKRLNTVMSSSWPAR
ncbi:hypothetical protein D3C87_1978250 [compost metagenome]